MRRNKGFLKRGEEKSKSAGSQKWGVMCGEVK